MGSQILIESLPNVAFGELSKSPENETVGSFFIRNEQAGDGNISALYVYTDNEWVRVTPLVWIGTVITNESGLFKISWGDGIFEETPTVYLSAKSKEGMEHLAIVGFDKLDKELLNGKVIEKDQPLPNAEVFIQAILI